MLILSIKRAKNEGSVKVYGSIMGDEHGDQPVNVYKFAYIRRTGFRGWICSCDRFIMQLFAKHRNCKHIQHVRAEYGRYGAQVRPQQS